MDDARGSVRRTVAFAVAMTVLLGSARAGASEVTVWVVFGVFISVSTIWIRGQYVDSMDGRQWVMPWRVGAVLAVVAAVLFALPGASWFGAGFCSVGALVLLYLLAGSVLTHLRQSPSVTVGRWRVTTGRFGVWLTGVAVLTVLAGALLLGSGLPILVGAAVLGLGALLLLPAGLALTAEGALRRLCRRDRATGLLWGLGVGGVAVFAGATRLAVMVSGSRWLTVVLVVLGLLVIVLVSTTRADIVAALALVALMGVTPSQEPQRETPDPAGRRNVLVAIGDSYMSGEGARVYYHGTDNGGVNECRRAPTAWAAMAAQAHFYGIQFLACSGARTRHILTATPPDTGSPDTEASEEKVRVGMDPGPEPQYPSERYTQLDAYLAAKADPAADFQPSMVVLSIGGNDAGFSSIGEMCVAPGDCTERRELWERTVPQLRAQLRVAYYEVDRIFRNIPVVVVPYPDPIAVRGDECTDVALSAREQAFIHEYVTQTLNPAIRATAREYGFHYLQEMEDALAVANLQLCDRNNDNRPGINFIGLRSVDGFAQHRFNPAKWMHGSLHPNERGHAAMLRAFERWREKQDPYIAARERINFAASVRSRSELHKLDLASPSEVERTAEAGRPPCDLLAAAEDGCRRQAQTWAYRKIGQRLTEDGLCLWITAAVGGAWCVGVAFFGHRRRVWARRRPVRRDGPPSGPGGRRGPQPRQGTADGPAVDAAGVARAGPGGRR
ncbi:GDSL-type esterase/lipase family protein [Actinoplanes philippinensis]|uniref:GDSL-type esterase/lipase family protein n=1 Tax=Actinoplanes philippinensis TaxID=35752 RepID=UPI001160B101|nr:GDSL-type esterase/lipase family protein [Actinoplanes philippinensis]